MAYEDRYGSGITLYGIGRYGGYGIMMPRNATINVESNSATVNIESHTATINVESNKMSSVTYRI